MKEPGNKNIYWNTGYINQAQREKLLGQQGVCLWLTGLPASGKSSIACEIEKMLFDRHILSYVLDGDNIRHGLNKDLGFSEADRSENIRRIGEVAKLFVDAGLVIITAFISPYRRDRQRVRDLLEKRDFIEIYVKASLETCERRDAKGLYKKARRGEITEFTGISAPYEEPENPELILDTDQTSRIADHAKTVVDYLEKHGYII